MHLHQITSVFLDGKPLDITVNTNTDRYCLWTRDETGYIAVYGSLDQLDAYADAQKAAITAFRASLTNETDVLEMGDRATEGLAAAGYAS